MAQAILDYLVEYGSVQKANKELLKLRKTTSEAQDAADKHTKATKRNNKQLAKAKKQLRDVNQGTKQLTSNTKSLTTETKKLLKAEDALNKSRINANLKITAVTVATATWMGTSAAAAIENDKLARSISMTNEELQSMQMHGRSVGIEGERMVDIVRDWNLKIAELAVNTGEMKAIQEEYAVALKGLNKEQLYGVKGIQNVTKALKSAGVPAEEVRSVLDRMASDADKLYPVIDKLDESFGNFNYQLTSMNLDKLYQLDAALGSLKANSTDVGASMLAQASPALSGIVDSLTATLYWAGQVNDQLKLTGRIGGVLGLTIGTTIDLIAIGLAGWSVTIQGIVVGWREIELAIAKANLAYEKSWLGSTEGVIEANNNLLDVADTLHKAEVKAANLAAELETLQKNAKKREKINFELVLTGDTTASIPEMPKPEQPSSSPVSNQWQEQTSAINAAIAAVEGINKAYKEIGATDVEVAIMRVNDATADQIDILDKAMKALIAKNGADAKSSSEYKKYEDAKTKALEVNASRRKQIIEQESQAIFDMVGGINTAYSQLGMSDLDKEIAKITQSFDEQSDAITKSQDQLIARLGYEAIYTDEYIALENARTQATVTAETLIAEAKVKSAEVAREEMESLAGYTNIYLDQLHQMQAITKLFGGTATDMWTGVSSAMGMAMGMMDKDSSAYKYMAATQAVVNTGLAVTQALAPPPGNPDQYVPTAGKIALASGIAALGAAQVTTILSAKDGASMVGYAGGTSFVDGSGTSKSDDIPAMLSRGESVLTKSASEAIGRNNIDSMNRGHMPNMSGGSSVSVDAPLIIQGNVDQSTMNELTIQQQKQVKTIADQVTRNVTRKENKAGGTFKKYARK